MTFILLYGLFAITTAFAGLYEIIFPVISEQKLLEGKVNDQTLIYIVSFCIFAIIAPLIFFACIIPSYNEKYKTYLSKGLFP